MLQFPRGAEDVFEFVTCVHEIASLSALSSHAALPRPRPAGGDASVMQPLAVDLAIDARLSKAACLAWSPFGLSPHQPFLPVGDARRDGADGDVAMRDSGDEEVCDLARFWQLRWRHLRCCAFVRRMRVHLQIVTKAMMAMPTTASAATTGTKLRTSPTFCGCRCDPSAWRRRTRR